MPTSKHRRKRSRRTKPVLSGIIARFKFGGIDIPSDLVDMLQSEGDTCYKRGREDKADGAAALTLKQFFTQICDSGLPEYINDPLTQAQYAQYMDGYDGNAYCERVIISKDY